MHNWVLPGPSHVAFVGTVGAGSLERIALEVGEAQEAMD